MSRRLLLLACSKRKRSDDGTMPALQRYDGPAFRVLRRYLQGANQIEGLDIYVLSAEFGLIPSSHSIPNYDRQMTSHRAAELRGQATTLLSKLAAKGTYQSALICAGLSYRGMLAPYHSLVEAFSEVLVVSGGQGKQLADLHAWLYQNHGSRKEQLGSQRKTRRDNRILLRGRLVEATTRDVFNLARKAVDEGISAAMNCQFWYVPVDGQRMSPKWLVSQMSSIPVGAFHSQEARRVLGQLGFEVRRA